MNRFIRYYGLFALVALFLGSCSSQRGNTGTSLSAWRSAVKGEWVLNSIQKENFPSGASVKTIFDEAPMECFIGSHWKLTGSGKGTINFNAEGNLCAPGAVREIFWSINNDEMSNVAGFQFKKILPGDKAKDVTVGYRLELESAGDGNMVMRMPLDVGSNSAGYLVFRFSK